MPRPTAPGARARISQLVNNLWDYAMVNDNFEDGAIPASKLDLTGLPAGSIDGSALTGLANIPVGAGDIPIANIPSIPGSQLTSLASIVVGAGVIPSANLPAASPSYFAVTGTSALTGNIQTGNARGTTAIDISTVRGVITNVASGANSILIGQNGTASGENSIAIGKAASAISQNSIAIGNTSVIGNSFAYSCIAIGENSYAAGNYSLSIGKGAHGGSSYAIAIGKNANTNSVTNGMAIGRGANVTGNKGIAIGYNVTSSTNMVTIGSSAITFTFNNNTGLLTTPDLRINKAPSVSVATASTHKVAVNFNGVTYYILLSDV